MSNKNLDLWRSVCVTDPLAVKKITGKSYQGNSPKPYWIVEQLTANFGPCGIGWGINILSERFERFDGGEALHVAVVRLWYVIDGQRGEIEQAGQTRAAYMTSGGKYLVDEDAPKKSITDAMVKCASYLGFAGDIFSGRWDDSRYVAEAGRDWRSRDAADNDQPPPPPPAQPPKPTPTPAEVAAQIVKAHAAGRLTAAQIAERLHITAETDGERASLIFEALPEALQGPVDAAMTGGAK